MDYKKILTLGFGWGKRKKERGLQYNPVISAFGNTPTANIETYYRLYMKNLDIQRSVEELQQAFFSSGFEVFKGDEEITNSSEGKKIESLFYSANQGGLYAESKKNFLSLKNKIIRDVSLTGNVFIERVFNARGELIGFNILDPRMFSIVADKYGNVIKYIQKGNFGQEMIEFSPDEIYHYVNKEDPNNPVWGMSILSSILYDVHGDLEASQMNWAFFKNNAIPSTMIMLDENLDEDQVTFAMEQLKAQFSGSKNKHKTTANYGIKGIQSFSPTHKDMDFLNQRVFTTKQVARAFGVPAMMLGLSEDLNYANSESQYQRYIEDTVRPLERIGDIIFTDLISSQYEGVEIRSVDNHLNTLERKSAFIKNLEGTLSKNEMREILGYESENI